MNLLRIMSRIRYAILPCMAIEFPFESSWATTGMKGQRSWITSLIRKCFGLKHFHEATIPLSSKLKGSGIQK